MNQYIIKKYISKITKQNIIDYANTQNISLTNNEINIIYDYIKNKSNIFLEGQHEQILKELKQKLTPLTYNKIEQLYQQYKNKI